MAQIKRPQAMTEQELEERALYLTMRINYFQDKLIDVRSEQDRRKSKRVVQHGKR